MDDVSKRRVRGSATALLLGTIATAVSAFPENSMCNKGDCVVFLNAKAEERRTCVIDIKDAKENRVCGDTDSGGYLVQGKRAQFRVVNRKFFADYSINIDGVTQLKQIAIQELEEAANLQTPIQAAVSAVSKGAAPKGLATAGQLSLRTAQDLLAELLDEGRASNPAVELESDWLVVEREMRKATADADALDETWKVLYGADLECRDHRTSLGAPDLSSSLSCVKELYLTEITGDWPLNQQWYSDEDKFRLLNVQIGDVIVLLKTLSSVLQQNMATMSMQLSALDGDLSQWKADLNTLRGNLAAAGDTIKAFDALGQDLDRNPVVTPLRRAQIKLKLMQDFGGGAAGGKPALDDAELNKLVDAYLAYYINVGRGIAVAQRDAFSRELSRIGAKLGAADPTVGAAAALTTNQTHLSVEVPAEIAQINAAQSQVLGRANEIYDRSAVPEPLDKVIDLSKTSGNLHVYYTVRRVDVFPRYTVPVITPTPTTAQQGTPLPPPANGAASSGASAQSVTTSQNSSGQVVAHGSFDVHDLYRATVVAAFAFSGVRDVTVKSRSITTGTANNGSTCSQSTPCSQPFLDKGSYIPSLLVGVNYYLRQHDTFPGAKRPIGQKLGVFGGVSATRLNSYFAGMGVEPFEAVQFTGGVNFVSVDSISGLYSTTQVYPGSPSFKGPSQWARGAFFSAGFNLSIFRKIFGSVTGLGTKTAGAGN